MKKAVMLCLMLVAMVLFSHLVMAQERDYGQLDPKPYDPETEPNIDMFIRSYEESMPRHTHGNIVERDILLTNDGDPMKPKQRGAVLTNLKRLTFGVLHANTTTTPTTLNDEQELFYIASGKGTVTGAGKTHDLYTGIGFIAPPGLEFTMKNIGDVPLTMYIMTENIPEGFEPNKELLVRDENVTPFTSTSVHWSHNYKNLISRKDGLATLRGMGPVWFNPMTMGQPHSHGERTEEIWFALDGDITILLGKQIRKLPVGSAYKIPPDGKTPHSTINNGDEYIKLFWFMN